MILRIDCYLMILLFLVSMQRTRKYLERGVVAEMIGADIKPSWRLIHIKFESTSDLYQEQSLLKSLSRSHMDFFRQSIYVQKNNMLSFPRTPISCQNSLQIKGSVFDKIWHIK